MSDSKLAPFLFPYLEGSWVQIDLNRMAFDWRDSYEDRPSDETLIDRVHNFLGVSYSLGGWLEDRAFLMRNQYQKPGHTWHLGIDYWVPQGTFVQMPVYGELLNSRMDPDQDGGWGGQLFFQTDAGVLILGHLEGIVEDRRTYFPGETVGFVGSQATNGGWQSHLHAQLCREYDPDVDGYAAWYNGIWEDFPDPETLIK